MVVAGGADNPFHPLTGGRLCCCFSTDTLTPHCLRFIFVIIVATIAIATATIVIATAATTAIAMAVLLFLLLLAIHQSVPFVVFQ